MANWPNQSYKLDRFKQEFAWVKHIPGDLAEFGVYNGQGARDLAVLDPQRIVWAFDTYEGIPAQDYDPDLDGGNPPGKWKPAAPPEELFEGFSSIQPVEGRFKVTFPEMPERLHLVLVHIDCDYYASYWQVLKFLEVHMQHGGRAVMDDYKTSGCGATEAVDTWLRVMPTRARLVGQDLLVYE